MFESILFRGVNQVGGVTDVGLLAEALLFYKQTIVAADNSTLIGLLKTIGSDDLLGLIKDKHISLILIDDHLGVHTQPGGIETHSFAAIEIRGDQTKKNMSREELLIKTVKNAIEDDTSAKKIAKAILDNSSHRKINSVVNKRLDVTQTAYADLDNETYVQDAVRSLLDLYAPTYSRTLPTLKFSVMKLVNKGAVVMHNIDYARANLEFHSKFSKKMGTLTDAFILSHLLNARGAMFLSADYMSEVVTSPAEHALLNIQFQHILQKRDRNAEEIQLFQDNFLNGHAIREVINKGERSFSDLRKLLEKSQRFKKHLEGIGPDKKLIAEYYKSATAETWVDSIITKTIRLAVCAGIGIHGPMTGLAVSAVDTFLIDKIFKGWKPHNFVQGPLTKFVDRDA